MRNALISDNKDLLFKGVDAIYAAARRFKAVWLARSVRRFRDKLVKGSRKPPAWLQAHRERRRQKVAPRDVLFSQKMDALHLIEEEAMHIGECAALIRHAKTYSVETRLS